MKKILEDLCKYINENEKDLSNSEFHKLYEAKELIKQVMQEKSLEQFNKYHGLEK